MSSNNNDRKAQELAALQALAGEGDEDASFILSQGAGNAQDVVGTWSKLSKYITAFSPAGRKETGTDLKVEIDLTCNICHIRHLRLHPWISGPGLAADPEPEPFCVLPCGHYFGFDCMSKWHALHLVCPMCRFRLRYLDCGHCVPVKEVDVAERVPSVGGYVSVIEHVPFTREHLLEPDHQKVFQDVSTWDPSTADQAHNYGMTPECYECTTMADDPPDQITEEFFARERKWWQEYLKW
ncbi:hypothetical protein F4678DRAFT_462944 [Xylaria arbuscula]|nr:hypothetical protein F4678DRAFT_462944 [Xylaria arbuscula]